MGIDEYILANKMKFGPLPEDMDDGLEDVPLSFDCHATITTHRQRPPSPRLEKIMAAIKYFFSMKKNND